MSAIDRSPARTSSVIAVAAAGTAVLATGGTAIGLGLGGAGVIVLGTGVVVGSRRSVSVGSFVVFAGVIVAGLGGVSTEALLVAAAAVVIAWDMGEQAINVGEQLGRAARTRRGELAHAASSTLLAAVSTGVGYVIFRLTTGGRPVTALVFLLAAGLALASALRD